MPSTFDQPRGGLAAPMEGVNDVPAVLARGPMTRGQVAAVVVCLLINALDGFDVQIVAFTAPAISAQWHLRPEALGVVLSAGLIGMGIGALGLSWLADVLGRRTVVLSCLGTIVLGMAAAAFCRTLPQLVGARTLTGIGIGGLISSVSALVAEYCSDRRRGLAMGLMAVSFPAGAMTCAAVSIPLISRYGWQSVFLVGAAATLLVVPVAFVFLPESVLYLMSSGRPRDRGSAERILIRLGLSPDLAAGTAAGAARLSRPRLSGLASTALALRLARLGGLFLCAMLSFYFLVNWAPKLAVQTGAPMSAGVTIGLLLNLGGVAGGIAAGLLIPRFGLRRVGRAALGGMAAAIAVFGMLLGRTESLMIIAVLAGFTLWSVQAAIYTAMTIAFPASVRATAIGLVTTGGRVGSALGPLIGGALLGRGYAASAVCLAIAVPALVGVLLLEDYGHGVTRRHPAR